MTTELLVIITEAGLESLLMQDIERLGAHGCTISNVHGRGSHGERDGTWDASLSIRVEIILSALARAKLVSHLEQTYLANYALVMYWHPINVLRTNKF